MPKRNKKKNRRQIEDDNNWDKSGSDEGELITTKDILKKKKKKKNKQKKNNDVDDLSDNESQQSQTKQNKKNKNKNKNKNKSQNETPSNDFDASDDESTKPVQKLSKKELRKLKKMQKYQEQSPDPFQEEDPEPPQNNKRKGKKKGKKGKQPQQHVQDDTETDNTSHKKRKQKKGKKNKANVAAQREAQLLKLKEERQEALLHLGNGLMGNLEIKYASYFNEDMKELWEGEILEIVGSYEDDYKDKVEDEEVLKTKKTELRAAWDEIFALIEQDYADAQEQRDSEKKERDRLKKLEELRAQGLNIGTGNKQNQPSAAARKAQQKREERDKLKALRARLAEMDKLAVAQERESEEKKLEAQKAEEERKRKEEEEARRKQEQIEAEQNADWGDDSSSDEEKPKENAPKKEAKQEKTTKNGNKPKEKTKEKDAFDSSDDEWVETASKKEPKKQAKVLKNTDPFNESDDEQQQQQQNKKRGGRRRKKKGKQENKENKTENVKKEEEEKKKENKVETPPPEPEKKQTSKQNNKKGKKGKKGKKKKDKKDKVELRSPICVVMGHVDTGKTKILDHIRRTNVQSKEAGGITQQIGATYLSIAYIKERTSRLKEQVSKLKYKIPGLLFIDTPGHEAFTNLRSRGSSMCDIAVIVVDLMHGLEPQTIESLNMLRERKSPFVVALNKIDVCYNWVEDRDAPFMTTYNNQSKATRNDFENRLSQVRVQFAEQGVNAELYTRNKRLDKDISLVPTSAITGEGIADLLYLIVQLTKKYMSSSIAFNASCTKASVLEVKQTQGYGATIDVIVSNGTLRSDDTIIICGMNGPIVSPIRALLLPHEAQEMRVKGEYRTVREVSASVGVRIATVEDLSCAVAGAPLFIVPRNLKPAKFAAKRREIVEDLKDEVQKSFADLFSKVDKGGRGVFVQASTLGSLEALIMFLSDQKVPISGIGIGTISKKTIMKAAVMLNFQPEFAVILAFNVRVAPDARILSEEQHVRIFEAEIIYHLQEQFENYIKQLKEDRKAAAKDVAVFPVEFKILSPEHIFNNKNPLVLGVQIVRGTLRLNTPICAQRWNASKCATPIYLGRVDGIKIESKDVSIAKMGDKVSVRIMGDDTQKNVQVGRTFDVQDALISEITRDSLDALKANFEEEMKDDADTVQHLGQLKQYFNII